jgi:hypothetical protein
VGASGTPVELAIAFLNEIAELDVTLAGTIGQMSCGLSERAKSPTFDKQQPLPQGSAN